MSPRFNKRLSADVVATARLALGILCGVIELCVTGLIVVPSEGAIRGEPSTDDPR